MNAVRVAVLAQEMELHRSLKGAQLVQVEVHRERVADDEPDARPDAIDGAEARERVEVSTPSLSKRMPRSKRVKSSRRRCQLLGLAVL
jgi:hypothetical protein